MKEELQRARQQPHTFESVATTSLIAENRLLRKEVKELHDEVDDLRQGQEAILARLDQSHQVGMMLLAAQNPGLARDPEMLARLDGDVAAL